MMAGEYSPLIASVEGPIWQPESGKAPGHDGAYQTDIFSVIAHGEDSIHDERLRDLEVACALGVSPDVLKRMKQDTAWAGLVLRLVTADRDALASAAARVGRAEAAAQRYQARRVEAQLTDKLRQVAADPYADIEFDFGDTDTNIKHQQISAHVAAIAILGGPQN
jgi:hypothetical protein